MTPVVAVANAVILLWAIAEIALAIDRRRAGDRIRDAGTFAGVWWSLLIPIVVSDGIGFGGWMGQHLPAGLLPRWVSIPGLGFVLIGVALRWWAIRVLGRYFTVRITVQADQPLIATGPYRRLRHPSYTGAWMACCGIGLVTGTWPTLILWTVLPLMAFVRRIRVEEAVLREHFGIAYDTYRQRTWGLVPWIY